MEMDQEAWSQIYTQYQSLIAGWVYRHPVFASSDEDVHYFINQAISRLWKALGGGRFSKFPELKSILRYLQLCVNGVLLDYMRAMTRQKHELEIDYASLENLAVETPVETKVIDKERRQDFWQWIESRLNNELERKVIFASYVLGNKPRQIKKQYPEAFQDIQQIYRIKENVISRLRRDPGLREFLYD